MRRSVTSLEMDLIELSLTFLIRKVKYCSVMGQPILYMYVSILIHLISTPPL
jgi:hypothetical protein